MMIARHAYANQSDTRANGYELFRGQQQCSGSGGAPCSPRPEDNFFWAVQSSQIWRLRLPGELAQGFHVAKVTFTNRFGRTFVQHFVFEVVKQRAFPFWNEQNFTQLP